MIRLDAITKSYGAHEAIRGLSFAVAPGECVGLLGLNGAGKSTTLKILAGLLQPTAGRVLVGETDVTEDATELRRQVGYLPERPPLYLDLTVREQLRFAGGLRAMSDARLRERVDAVARDCDLTRVLDVTLGTLSHGFRQRAGIAQAVLHEPDLLILDEPTQGLDPMQIAEVRALITRLRGAHTILLSTHILSEIEAVCDRILVLHEGAVAAEGTEAALVQRYGHGEWTLEVELSGDQGSVDKAQAAHPEVNVELIAMEAASVRLRVNADRDARAEISRALVGAGLDLLALKRVHSGLEAMFSSLESSDKAAQETAG